jgi:hypothetical protein
LFRWKVPSLFVSPTLSCTNPHSIGHDTIILNDCLLHFLSPIKHSIQQVHDRSANWNRLGLPVHYTGNVSLSWKRHWFST